MKAPVLSIVIPVYNGGNTIEELVKKVFDELRDMDTELILVNDGSKDNSEAICSSMAESDSRVRFISLRKNFGEHNAVLCGLNYVRGKYAVIIDDDFQNPPEEIIKLVDEVKYGYDVVYTYFEKKRHNLFRNFGSRMNDYFANLLIGKPKGLYLSSFKLITREVIDEIIKYKGPFPYIDGLVLRVTRNISSIRVRHDTRKDGKSNYTLGKLVSLYLNMFLNFSIKPIRLFTLAGLIISLLGFLLAIYFIVYRLFISDVYPGWTSIVSLLLFFQGIQFVFIGLLGEYLGKAYLDQNGSPQWVIRKTMNI